MARPLVYVLPSLLVGALAGFFVSGTLHKPSKLRASSTSSTELLASTQEDGSEVVFDYQKLARACVEAARHSGGQRAGGVPGGSSQDQERAKSALAQVEERALTSGVWSRVSGFKAQSLLGTIPSEERQAFAERINEQIRTGVLRPQSGAWLPEDQAQ